MKSIVNESVFYHIYPLGFCGAPEYNDMVSPAENRLEKVIEWIPHLKDMGINGIYLGPLFESEKHGYDTIDYSIVDRRLGDNETLKKVVGKLHENGIKVILDCVFNHVGRNFWAFQDIINKGQVSDYCSWFSGLDFTKGNPMGDPFDYSTWDGHYDLVKFNLTNPDVKNYLISVACKWIEEFDIDGLRLDAADVMDHRFLRELTIATKNVKEDFWLKGEVVHGDYRNWANENVIDSTTNYECYKGMYSSLNDKNYFEIAYSLKRQFGEGGCYKHLTLYNFVDNHDVSRVRDVLTNPAHLYPVYGMLFTIPGIPSIYYGSEWGIKGKKNNHSDRVLRPEINLEEINKNTDHPDLKKAIKKLIECRKNSEALKYGDYEEVYVAHEQIVFKRESEKEIAMVAINAAEESCKISLEGKFIFNNMKDILNDEIIGLTPEDSITVPGNWLRIVTIEK